MSVSIKFGTDGWRAIIADDFTYENVAYVAKATAEYYRKHKRIRNGIVIGYDARFSSKEFAEVAARVIASANIRVILSSGIATTPAISLAVRDLKAAAGVVITASHNPGKYNGYKLKGEYGGPSDPADVSKVEAKLPALLKKPSVLQKALPLAELVRKKKVIMKDLHDHYIADIRSKIDIDAIQKSGIRILYDAMHGSGQGVVERILPDIALLRQEFNPSFGGANPEPLPPNMPVTIQLMKTGRCDVAIVTDGDADRIGIVDEEGNFVDSHRIFCIILKYLIEEKHMTGEVAKSFSVTTMVNQMCEKYGLTLHETPVGFKYLCRLMVERDILIAGEESGGLGVKGHLPERDGIYLGLLMCEIMAKRKKKMSELVQELFDEYGAKYFSRYDAHLTEKEKNRIMSRFRKNVKEIAGMPVLSRSDLDGHKFFLEGGWLLVRASGTEPIIRLYAEADSPEKVERLLNFAAGK